MKLKLAVMLGLITSLSMLPFADFAVADPYIDWGTIDGIGIDFIVTLTSPTNSSLYTSDSVPLTFTAGIQNLNTNLKITNVEFFADWVNGTTNLNENMTQGNAPNGNWGTFLHCNITLQGVPEGNHTLTVRAHEDGYYVDQQIFLIDVNGNRNVTTNFVVDLPPTISFFTPQNQTYDTSNVTLSFMANKPISKINYTLDNHENMTINSDTAITINNVPNGKHNVTVYAQDTAGVSSVPATFFFNVKTSIPSEPFPVVLSLTAISIVIAVAVGICAIFFIRKTKKRKPSTQDTIKGQK